MAEAEIRFERENLSGIVPVGTYLADAARRLGVRFDGPCETALGEHCCAVSIQQGGDLLSPLTAAETNHFSAIGGERGMRLACQAKIERPGEMVVMTKQKKKAETEEQKIDDKNEQYKKEFAEMPLEKKIASLVQLEAIALGETFSFILNSPFMIFDKAMDVMAEFGFKKEADARRATRPEEHTESREKSGNGAKTKSSTKKRSVKEQSE